MPHQQNAITDMPTLFTNLLSLLSGVNANLAAQLLAWLLSGKAIAAAPRDTAQGFG